MKIENMKINAYGRLHNVNINLTEGINIIQGKNESGKSTLLKFIINSFYGTSKNKKGKDISDYEKFKPWDGEDFSGKLKYKLDNGNSFEIYREFNKKNPKIFNENLEEISKQFNIDKNKGNEFFYEQTKIDEELFLTTSAILQQEIKIEKNKQTTLIQKIANLVGTGDDNVSFKRAIERLDRRRLDEVGTERSREKPINIIDKRIKEIKTEIQQLENYEDEKYEIDNNKKEIISKIKNEEIKYEILKEIKKINDRKEIEKEKINIQEKIKKENEEKINTLKNKIEIIELENKKEKEHLEKENLSKKNKTKNKMIIASSIIIIVNLLQMILINNINVSIIILLISVVLSGAIVYIKARKSKPSIDDAEIFDQKEREVLTLKSELKLLEQNTSNIESELQKINNEFNFKYNLEKEKIKNNYLKKLKENKKIYNNNLNKKENEINNFYIFDEINENEINNYFNLENINYFLEDLQKNINNEKINLQTLEINKENIEKKLEIKAKLEEELSMLSEQYVNLQNLNISMNLAKEVLNSSYEKMKESVTPRFTEYLSNTISKITERKV
ncbi:MAG: AAA family ATPase [Clostridia bacterium]|nr:AAA family ATPase [Clostridia bacterium]